MNSNKLEKYSSAITLSDMEVFVFPELMYSLLLANIMSPIIWQWRELDCFKKLDGKSIYRKLMRLKQFIIDEFEFNLDLETWGLTNQAREIKRFEKFIPPEDISRSNALLPPSSTAKRQSLTRWWQSRSDSSNCSTKSAQPSSVTPSPRALIPLCR